MRLRSLGKTGLKVSALGLGTVKFGRNQAVKYPEDFDLPDDSTIAGILDTARELGINLLDTAPAYGSSEERIGAALQGQRQDWLICTKVGEEFDPGTGLSRFDFSANHARRSIERSLKCLQTDWLDIVLVHSDGNDLGILRDMSVLSELARLKEKGLLRAFGVSTKTVKGGLAALELCDCVMVTYHHEDRTQLPVLDRAAILGKGLMIKKPLGSGYIARNADMETLQANFQVIFSHPAVDTAIVGTINPAHLRMNAEACGAVTLV